MPESPESQYSATITEWEDGVDLVLSTATAHPVEEVWTHITDPAKTAAWCAPWHYTDEDAGQLVLTFDDGTLDAQLVSCEQADHVLVDVSGLGTVGLTLRAAQEATTIYFTHTFDTAVAAAVAVPEVGPVWETHLRLLRCTLDDSRDATCDIDEATLIERYEKLAQTVPGGGEALLHGAVDEQADSE